jgi:pimeloyl-ACP methyl ester carboxylesterase
MHELSRLPPIAVFWGDRDRMIPIAHGRAFARAGEGVVFNVFPGCGHYLHHDRPDLLVQALIEFLDAPAVKAARLLSEGGSEGPT